MLNLFNSFVVPGVERVTMYHDDERDDVFYMLPTKPRFARAEDGGPQVNVMAFARDLSLMADTATKLPAGETEGGLVSLSVELSVSEEEQEAIRSYILTSLYAGGRRTVARFADRALRFAVALRPATVELRYPLWVDGSVTLSMFPVAGGATFVKAVEGSEHPSLIGENVASWTVLLGQEGVRLLRESVSAGAVSPGVVHYELTYAARFPSLKVTVDGNSSDVYRELRDLCTVEERYGSSTWTYPQVSSLQKLRESVTSLTIVDNVNDIKAGLPSEAASADVVAKLEAMVLTLVQSIIEKKFLAPGPTAGLKAEDLGTDPFAHDPNRKPGDPPRNGNVLYLREYVDSMEGEIHLSIESNRTSTFQAYPSALLFEMVEPDVLARRTVTADLNTPLFNVLEAPVRVTADFAQDPIAQIDVDCVYSQRDDQTGQVKSHHETFSFLTGQETYYFRTVLAKDHDGRPKDEWTYSSVVHYKAAADALTVPARPTTERTLTIGYDRLDCVDVTVSTGAVDWSVVEKVRVHLHHPTSSDPDADRDLYFDATTQPTGWFVHTGESGGREYEYALTFVLLDGQKLEQPVQRSSAARLVVDAPFDDRLQVTFVPQGTFPPISSIALSVAYDDDAHGYHPRASHIFTGPADAWTWSLPLQDTTRRGFSYAVDISYADGSASHAALEGAEGTVLVGEVAEKVLQVEVVPALLDMTRWKLVVVRLRHGTAEKNLQFTAANAAVSQVWKVPLEKAADRAYGYEVTAYPVDPAGTKAVVAHDGVTDPLLVLEV